MLITQDVSPAGWVIPAAALDAVIQEEAHCRERLTSIGSDFLHLCWAKLQATAKVIRMMTREEAVRCEIEGFFKLWSEKASRLASRNGKVVRVLQRNVFRLRARYVAKWIRRVAIGPPSVLTNSGSGDHHGVGLTLQHAALFRAAMRCLVLSVFRLPPVQGARNQEGNHGTWGCAYESLAFLAPSDGDLPPPKSNSVTLQHNDDVAQEATLLMSILQRWTSRVSYRRKLVELTFRETAKRKMISSFEAAERARGGFQ
jgi:hypothetical protein